MFSGMDDELKPLLVEINQSFTKIFECLNRDVVGEDYLSLFDRLAKVLWQKEADFASTSKVISILIDITWEKLNTGHWKDVDISWRYGYALASLSSAIVSLKEKNFLEAIKACDRGILMGAPVMDQILPRLASIIHRRMNHDRHCETLNTTYVRWHSHVSAKMACEKKSMVRPLSPTDLKHPLMREADLSLESFLLDYIEQCSPIVLCKSACRWPAVQKWNVEYIWRLARFRTVPVEIGSSYADDQWSQSLMTIGDFIDKFFIESNSSIGYLAQHHLLDQVIELRQDILVPDYCMADENDVEINAWFGPAGTISPLHFDPRNNILVQIFGRKYVRLYAPSETKKLYPHETTMLKNTSKVDVQSPNLELYPDFEYASYVECILEPGDMLFMPKKWWHFVKSLENSFSVNFWFGDA